MADVTEVIHKISYEVNDDALINATKAIQAQIVELNSLQKTLEGYTKQLGILTKDSTGKFEELAIKIEDANKKIRANVTETKGALDEVFKGILNGFNIPDTLKDSVTKFVKDVRAEYKALDTVSKNTGRSMKGVAKGMTGVSGASSKALSTVISLGKSLFSFTNVVGIALNLLPLLISFFSDSSESADEAAQKTKKYKDALEDLAHSIASEVVELDSLVIAATDVSKSYKERSDAIDKLQRLYPSYFGRLNREKILAGDVGSAYKGVTQRIIEAAEARAKQKVLEDAIYERELNRISYSDLTSNRDAHGNPQFNYVSQADIDIAEAKYNASSRKVESIIKNLYAPKYKLDPNDAYAIDGTVRKQVEEYQKKEEEQRKLALMTEEERKKYLKQLEDNKNKTPQQPDPKPIKVNIKLEPVFDESELKSAIEEIDKITALGADKRIAISNQAIDDEEQKKLLGIENAYKAGLYSYEKYEEEKEKITREYGIKRYDEEIKIYQKVLSLQGLTEEHKQNALRGLTNAELGKVSLENIPKKNNDTQDKGATEGDTSNDKLARIVKEINAYGELAEAAVQAYSTIAKAQEEALDKEIAIREKRVEEAKKLAERGNSEALRIEQERLEDAQKKKEEIGRREQAVNSALALSNSLVAVTSAIATATKSGDPYTVAARVAAAIAAVLGALVAGQSFVKSFDTSTGAFADGVVDYKGKGGPRDDQNLVRISNGESVITAEGTQRNRALLEAINRGENFSLMGNGLPFVMPQFISPTGSTRYASATNMRNVERKLDGVVAAIEDNRLKQNIFFNEHGVGLMTERAIKKNNRRFK